VHLVGFQAGLVFGKVFSLGVEGLFRLCRITYTAHESCAKLAKRVSKDSIQSGPTGS